MPEGLLDLAQLQSEDHGLLFQRAAATDAAIHGLLDCDAVDADLLDLLINWLRIRAAQSRARGVIVGISGGLDSAVVAGVAARAFPASNRYVFLPIQSIDRDRRDAGRVAESLGVTLEVHDLEPTYVAACGALDADPDEHPSPLLQMNLKASLRYVFLAGAAIQSWLMIASTANRSELEHTGIFSKRTVADVVVLGHLFKEQVREIGRLLGLPAEILDKPASNGMQVLPDGTTQLDEDELGMSYPEVQLATRLFMEFGTHLPALTSAVRQRHAENADRVLTVCRNLGLRSWKHRHAGEPIPIAGNPRQVQRQYDVYPNGFPYPQQLLHWKWGSS